MNLHKLFDKIPNKLYFFKSLFNNFSETINRKKEERRRKMSEKVF